MKKLKYFLSAFLLIGATIASNAGLPINQKGVAIPQQQASSRAACVASTSQAELRINNVRARLLGAGDFWWDGKSIPKYVVPKVGPGEVEVSSIFAGAVWIGGKDNVGNIKLAAMAYRTNGFDFWPGPLDPEDGSTNDTTCSRWDRYWRVLGSNIDIHLKNYRASVEANTSYDCGKIPEDVKGWPGKGNPYFFELNKFELPKTGQGLAAFFDQNNDDQYNPCDGDYPIIEIRMCEPPEHKPVYPDEMLFCIYNDNGNVHTQSKGSEAIKMEVQVQAFAYATNDELNNMTFMRYKLINRAKTLIKDCYFAMWLDPDLGCATDDYIGCDTSRSLMYVYNQDATDGETGCACGSTKTYCQNVPMVGCDYFRGPLVISIDSTTGKFDTAIGRMTSFTYYINGGGPCGAPCSDPSTAQEYYNYITGKWKDGTRLTYGANGYNSSSTFVNYAFFDEPCRAGWSMAKVGFKGEDFRTLQATGPILLYPGQVNELIVGLPWVANVSHPAPCISQIQQADDIAQDLFDSCFDITDGPDAPDVDIVELNRELVLILTNDLNTSNNKLETYAQKALGSPKGLKDSMYVFEGYRIYQLVNEDVSTEEFGDPEKARIIFQVDVKNGVKEIYNWSTVEDPNNKDNKIFVPNSMTLGRAKDEGTRHTLSVTEDQFAQLDKKLVNHRKYYFRAVAYAYNNYAPFDPRSGVGQKKTYLQGRKNGKNYTGIPRPIVDRTLQAKYGDAPIVKRYDGVGTGENFLNITDAERERIFVGENKDTVTYAEGGAPVDIKIFNPLDVKDGEYELVVKDTLPNDTILNAKIARWTLKRLGSSDPIITAETTFDKFNEQVIAKYGFSVAMGQVEEPGSSPFTIKSNGAIGSTITYKDISKPEWFNAMKNGSITFKLDATTNGTVNNPAFKMIANTDPLDLDYPLDPNQSLSTMSYFVPFALCDYRLRPVQGVNTPYITPGYLGESTAGNLVRNNGRLADLNNVDIVFTSDKSKWSRCIVVETANLFYTTKSNPNQPATRFYMGLETEKNPAGKFPLQFDLRGKNSVGKNDADGDGKPDFDDAKDAAGQPIYGMGWFPGYAVDVETGKRLNIFFGENSTYNSSNPFANNPFLQNGNDMLWNPNPAVSIPEATEDPSTAMYSAFLGGQHQIYVTRSEYDECETFRKQLQNTVGNKLGKVQVYNKVTWTALPLIHSGTTLLPLGNGSTGLIPNDMVMKLRVTNSYQVQKGIGTNNNYPTYVFSVKNREALALTAQTTESALDMINVVPNPYYGFSDYEISQFSNVVKITNLPAKCVVTIYSLDGQFIKQYKRDETPGSTSGRSNAPVNQYQITPALEWDLKNAKGIPVSSGVYLIHINAPGMGERIIKWFGVARQFDPSGL